MRIYIYIYIYIYMSAPHALHTAHLATSASRAAARVAAAATPPSSCTTRFSSCVSGRGFYLTATCLEFWYRGFWSQDVARSGSCVSLDLWG